ncbi:MAG: glycosyl transferase family 90 [Pseudomonadota bacterium]
MLLPLDRHRHFEAFPDRKQFEEKQPGAVWRGGFHNQLRSELVDLLGASPDNDIAAVGGDAGKADYLSPRAQLDRQVILSVEGFDVATNLKWAMGSNSLAMSPPLKYETWYMEARLKPGHHFVEIKPDFSDLDAATAYYARHPDKARVIIAAANAWRAQFDDTQTEDMIAAAVIQKYLQLSQS